MKRMRILGLALVAVFAFAAMTAASASATNPLGNSAEKAAVKKSTLANSATSCAAIGAEGKGAKYNLVAGIGKGKGFKGKGKRPSCTT